MGFSKQEYWSGVLLPSPMLSKNERNTGDPTRSTSQRASLHMFCGFPHFILEGGCYYPHFTGVEIEAQ